LIKTIRISSTIASSIFRSRSAWAARPPRPPSRRCGSRPIRATPSTSIDIQDRTADQLVSDASAIPRQAEQQRGHHRLVIEVERRQRSGDAERAGRALRLRASAPSAGPTRRAPPHLDQLALGVENASVRTSALSSGVVAGEVPVSRVRDISK
jgi:hypothetical protein